MTNLRNADTQSNRDPVIYADEPASKPRGKLANAVLTAFSPLFALFRFLRKYTNLTVWIIISLILGIIVGKFAPSFGVQIKPLGELFIRMIQTIVVSAAWNHGAEKVWLAGFSTKRLTFATLVGTSMRHRVL
jgi:hypothetical protein